MKSRQALRAYESALSARKREDVDELVQLLSAQAPELRAEAATALGRLRAPEATDPLVARATTDASWQVRREAVHALGAMPHGTDPIVAALCRAAADEDGRVRYFAMDSPRRLPSRDAVPVLALGLDADNRNERWSAVRGSGGDRAPIRAPSNEPASPRSWRGASPAAYPRGRPLARACATVGQASPRPLDGSDAGSFVV